MFRTFAPAEPSWNNKKPILGNNLEQKVYENYTFADLMREIQVSRASPDLVRAFKKRCASGIRVPEDYTTLKEATEWLKQFGGKYISLFKDADNGHLLGNEKVKIPNKIVLGAGEHQIDGDFLEIVSAMSIVGDPEVERSEIVVVGGIEFEEGIQGNCHLQHLTLRQAKHCGVYAFSSFTMKDVLVEQCRYGVVARGTGVVGRCINVEVRQCGGSGVKASDGASITLIGAKTTVHHNCTKGKNWSYGLMVSSSSSTIQLVSPLTKKQVSLDNGGGGNWGTGYGCNINQIKTIKPEAEVHVPEDCNTLKEAVERVHGDDRLTTIVLGKGKHQIDGTYLMISSAMNIVGDPGVPKSEIVVVGGIKFRVGIQGNSHLQHLTLRQAKWIGVRGSSSFTMDDVLVDQCGGEGVLAGGTGVVGRCTNVEVRQCGGSGVRTDYGASITLIGAKTTVHHNCTKGKSYHYGLAVYNSSFWGTTIQLVSPLTKEQVSFANGGGGNWGAENGADINQIKTIIERVPEAEVHVPEDSSESVSSSVTYLDGSSDSDSMFSM
jgi:hypothetical protein